MSMLRTIVAVSLLLVLSGCDAECDKMRQCCEQLAAEEWVGDACGSILESVQTPKACRAVTDAIGVAAAERKAELPAVCQ